MKIRNIGGLSHEDLRKEVAAGARLIYYPYTISFVLVTFKRKSDLYIVRKKDNAARKAFPYLLLSAFFGWWGIPLGPKLTLQSIAVNRKGGKDITEEVMSILDGRALFRQVEEEKAHYQHS
jgi:hypothetical protein